MCQGSLRGGGAHRAPRTFRQTNSDIHTNLSFEQSSPLSKSRALLCPYSKSCSSSTSSMKIPAFAQAAPRYCPHAMEHFIPCFWQLHREELQSVAQLQRMIFKRSAGAGALSVRIGKYPKSERIHPH